MKSDDNLAKYKMFNQRYILHNSKILIYIGYITDINSHTKITPFHIKVEVINLFCCPVLESQVQYMVK